MWVLVSYKYRLIIAKLKMQKWMDVQNTKLKNFKKCLFFNSF